jgi:hypothetical protein
MIAAEGTADIIQDQSLGALDDLCRQMFESFLRHMLPLPCVTEPVIGYSSCCLL